MSNINIRMISNNNKDSVIVSGQLCTHCKSENASYECVDNELVLTCLCGHYEVVYSEREESTVTRTLRRELIHLPRPGSKLSKCLGAAASLYPETFNTSDVARVTKDKNADAATKLMVLQHKGLVEKMHSRRGVLGGSEWKLSNSAIKLLHLGHGG